MPREWLNARKAGQCPPEPPATPLSAAEQSLVRAIVAAIVAELREEQQPGPRRQDPRAA